SRALMNTERRPRPRGALAVSTAFVAAGCCAVVLATAGYQPSDVFSHFAGQVSTGSQLSLDAAAAPSAVAMRAYSTAPVAEPPEDLMSIKQRALVPSAEHLEYAVVEYSGRQHMVVEGGMYETYFIRAVPGAKVRFNRVLLMKRKVGDAKDEFEISVGQPLVDGAYVEVTILEHLKSEDQTIFKHKKKKHYMKRWIVNQKLTRFRIDKIVMGQGEKALFAEEVPGRAPYPLWDSLPPTQ
ncbi:unnamed protein product, partial [Polarella glacialis]